jgi:2,3-bisphosphoglycerate-independent phosphoglycerate mutase
VGQMGNSEVGHLNIGAGRIVFTGLSIINNAVETGDYYKNEAFLEAINHAKKNNGKVHIFGLISDGGVHSSLNHIENFIKLCKIQNANAVLHIVTDGRDVPPQSIETYLDSLTPICEKSNVKIGSIGGRYFAMDRDKNFDRVNQFYEILVGQRQSSVFNDIKQYVKSEYEKGHNDEFFTPALNAKYDVKEITLADGDSFVSMNFRPDRSRQICHMVFGSDYYDYKPEIKKNNIYLVTLMKYEGIVPSATAFPPTILKNVFGKVLADHGKKQLRIAETEKYAHVTFFFDGGEEVNYDNEEKIIIPSPKVATYDLQPEMSAFSLCDKLLNAMEKNDVIIANFANGDMVGHTGNFDAAVRAVEVVDECVGKIYEKAQSLGYTLFITADHGNADVMLDDNNNVVTSHTTNVVPFIITDKNVTINGTGKLGNIAPTILKYLDVFVPLEMTEKPLI